jgi:uncharacterized spore protein YtfJ
MVNSTANATDELVHRLSNIPDQVGAAACFGMPVERDGHTLIPVARVSFGYGLGFGRGSGSDGAHSADGSMGDGGEGEGGGGGGGGSSTPVAIIDISSGAVEVQSITDPTRLAMSTLMAAGWIGFWLLWTVRAIAREGAKTQRLKIDKGLS